MRTGNQTGFTLTELMIAMVLGVILAGGVVNLFVVGQRSFRMDENVARMQDEGRFAINELMKDLRMAGYIGELVHPVSILQDPALATGTDCGVAGQPNWILEFFDAVTGEINSLTTVDNATGATANAGFSCINGGEILPQTDVVGVKRFAGRSVPPASLVANTIYMQSNALEGVMYKAPIGAGVADPLNEWEYRPRIYYIRNFTNTAGDGIPSLCRKTLDFTAATGIQTECIAAGIENLQIEYGLDADGSGSVNQYLPNPTLAQLQRVISARIFLLARTLNPDIGYTDDRTYTLSNAAPFTPNDNLHRRLYTVTVPIFNMRNRARLMIGI
jgi:prepilin-type N-terminal cleavage/methylation domain-containing protein